MKQVTFPLNAANVAEVVSERDAKIAQLTDALEDAVNTLESMDLHVDNPLYERLRAVLEN